MAMDKDEFLLLLDRLRSQYEKDLSSADVDDEDLWAATLQLLALVFGREKSLLVQRWLFDSECGRYPTEDFPFRSADELWNYMKTN